MKVFAVSVALQLKRALRRKGLIACLLALPFFVLLLWLALPPQGQNNVLVGVYCPQNSPYAEAFMQNLNRTENGPQFVQAQSRQQVDNLVAAGVWECGFVLADNFDEQIQRGRYVHIITCVRSQATSLDGVVREAVSAALLEACAPSIAQNYAQQAGISAASGSQWQALAAEYFTSALDMEVETVALQGPGGEGQSQPAQATLQLLGRGLVSLFMFLLVMLCLVWFLQDMKTAFYELLRPGVGAAGIFLPVLLTGGGLALLAGLGGTLLLGLLAPGAVGAIGWEALCLLAYTLYLCGIAFLLGSLVRAYQFWVAVLPFAMVACLVFCPIVLDISKLVPVLRPLAVAMPPTLYLYALQGQTGALVAMWAALPVLVCAGAAVLGLRRLRGGQKRLG